MRPDDHLSHHARPHVHHIATIGLHSSASTWVFNVVRELLVASFGEASVQGHYADEMAQLPAEGLPLLRHFVLKSHQGSRELDDWLLGNDFRIVLSIRDPRDAALSMAQRFKAPLAFASGWILADCERIMRLAGLNCQIVRYEDRFFDHFSAVAHLAELLQISVATPDLQSIFDRYRTEQVRAFARTVKDRPSELTAKIDRFVMDKVTHIFADRHIGDARTGKWRDLPAATQTELTRIFAPFLERFAY